MIGSLDTQTKLTVDEKLKHLEAKEIRLKEGTDREHAHAAFRKGGKYVPPQRRDSRDSKSESGRECE
jgi:general stress protein YciG